MIERKNKIFKIFCGVVQKTKRKEMLSKYEKLNALWKGTD